MKKITYYEVISFAFFAVVLYKELYWQVVLGVGVIAVGLVTVVRKLKSA